MDSSEQLVALAGCDGFTAGMTGANGEEREAGPLSGGGAGPTPHPTGTPAVVTLDKGDSQPPTNLMK
jgi:hypothetical protein